MQEEETGALRDEQKFDKGKNAAVPSCDRTREAAGDSEMVARLRTGLGRQG